MSDQRIFIKKTGLSEYFGITVPVNWCLKMEDGLSYYSDVKQGITLVGRCINLNEIKHLEAELSAAQHEDYFRFCKTIVASGVSNSYKDWQHEYQARQNAPANYPQVMFCWSRIWQFDSIGFILECTENHAFEDLIIDWEKIFASVSYFPGRRKGDSHAL